MRGQSYAGVAAGDRGGGRQIAAGAVTGHTDAFLVAAEFGDAGDDVLRRREGVLEGAGKPHLGRASIINRDDDRAGLDRKPARLPVMGVEIAGDPAAAVEEHDRWRFLVRVPVDPRAEEPGGTFHFEVLRAHHRRRRNRRARGRQRA